MRNFRGHIGMILSGLSLSLGTSAAAADAPKTSGRLANDNHPVAVSEEGEPAPAPAAERNIRYIVNPDGMRVEVDGLVFTPKAELVKSGKGSGIKLRVEVRAKDGKTHSLLAPEKAPLAFAGKIRRKDQEEEQFSDKREGDHAVTVGEKLVKLQRTWPAAGVKPLSSGDELELLVGIWGVGPDEASRRPLKKFCKITVKFDRPKPRVIVAPPDGATR